MGDLFGAGLNDAELENMVSELVFSFEDDQDTASSSQTIGRPRSASELSGLFQDDGVGGACPPSAQDALRLLGQSELDKTNMDSYSDEVLRRDAGTTLTVAEVVQKIEATLKFQQNPGVDLRVGPGTFNIVSSYPQTAKTAFLMFIAKKVIVEHKMPVVILAQNKTPELDRLEKSMHDTDRIFTKYCTALGTPTIPTVRATREDDMRGYQYSLEKWVAGTHHECPIHVMLFNWTQIGRRLPQITSIIRDKVGTDEKGRTKVNVIFDEGDLAFKTSDHKSTTEKKLFTTLFENLSAVTFVTSTLPALLHVDLPLEGRELVFTDLTPSTNYIGYESTNEIGSSRTIARHECDEDEYIQMVSTAEGSHAGMIFAGGSTKVKRRESAKMAAEKNMDTPGWCMVAWSSFRVDVYTASKDVITILGVQEGEQRLFAREVFPSGVNHFCHNGDTRGSGIDTYPKLVTFLVDNLRQKSPAPGVKLKSILFAKEMADRGTTISGVNHEHHLSSMFVSLSSTMHDEAIVQACGRLAAIELHSPGQPVTTKKLCGSADMHARHEAAISTCKFASDFLQLNFNKSDPTWLPETLRVIGDEVKRLQDMQCKDKSGAMEFSRSNSTRKDLMPSTLKTKREVDRNAKKRRVVIEGGYEKLVPGVQEGGGCLTPIDGNVP